LYERIEKRVVLFLYDIFQESVHSASLGKKKSTIVFEVNMRNLKECKEHTLFSMLNLYIEYFDLI